MDAEEPPMKAKRRIVPAVAPRPSVSEPSPENAASFKMFSHEDPLLDRPASEEGQENTKKRGRNFSELYVALTSLF